MEKNYISKHQSTCFYIIFDEKKYGVCINIKDIDRAEEIIKNIIKENKKCIEALKKEWKEEVK